MRWKRGDLDIKMTSVKIIFTMMALSAFLLQTCSGTRPLENSRKGLSALYLPEPSAESLTAIAQAMGAAGFEDYTEGKTLVKRLIPADSQPDLDVVEHMGIIGRVGVDFPALPNIPSTGFNCKNVPTGYYADLETDCQVFHICDTSRKISFLCPNGTIFSQSHLICDWWFKVDCASAPALYEASVEYYSNEQKKAQKVGQNHSKNRDIQQIGADSNVRSESRRAPVHIPTTTERLLRHRQKLQSNGPAPTDTPTSRSYQALFEINPTHSATEFEKRRKNLVQLISNDFGNHPLRTTLPVYDSTTRKTILPVYDHNNLKEMQVAEETASFANNQNRKFLQEYNSKTFRPYPVYTPNLPSKTIKTKNNPTLTTLYDITSKTVPQYTQEATTKRQTLVPYTKTYTINDSHEPYTRPGVSLLREFLEKEKNKTISATTDKITVATGRSDTYENKKSPENKRNFESATKIPYTIRDIKKPPQMITVKDELVHSNPTTETTVEISYKDRRERLQKKLELDREDKTEPTLSTVTEKNYSNQSNRPGLLVPPSLTPKTLHSLAIYYATALDNLATTTAPEEIETTTHAIDDYDPIEQGLPALFSQQTIAKYGNLFRHESNNAEILEEIKLDPNGTYSEIAEDLTAQMSQGPLATSPQIRELAQVFTHALSAYLQDPIKFRKVLSDIRPTHPSFAEMLGTTEDTFNTEATTTVNEEDDEILGFSDDHKIRLSENTIRSGKALNIATDYPTTIEEVTTTVKPTTDVVFSSNAPTTFRNPFRCCGRISASYTTAPTPKNHIFTSVTNSAAKINSLANFYTETASTENSNTQTRNGHFQNINTKQQTIADSPYFNDYTETTTLPTRSDVDVFDTTYSPITNSHQLFESKKIRTTTITPESTPTYFTDNDSIELENEEELQRAHSQSFVSPQTNNIRKGKQLKLKENSSFKKPAENLETPTESSIDVSTTVPSTTQESTTLQDQAPALTTVNPAASSIFTSPDSDKSTNDFQWPTTFGNWQSTIIDPITLNDGLSPSEHERDMSDISQQTNVWGLNTATTPSSFSTTNEPAVSTTINVEVTTTNTKQDERFGRLLADVTSTEPAQDISVVTDSLVEKAKEIMGGMNSTTTQKLMNVMKKTKSKTVKRLILLLVQTCDDDHNSTAEASKKALLEALMAVSQKDMDEIAKEEDLTEAPSTVSSSDIVKTEFNRRMDRIPVQPRRGKSLNIDADAINSLSTQSTTENTKTEDAKSTTITTARTTRGNRRGSRKYSLRTTELDDTQTTVGDRLVAEARVAPQSEVKIQPDTRALELLRSLYTIAARWG